MSMVLSNNGQAQMSEPVTIDPFMEFGVSGLKAMGGVLSEEFLKDLQGDRAIKVYREMSDNDPVVGAILFAIDMLIRQVEYRVEPSEMDAAGEWSQFIEECMHDMSFSWADTLSSIQSFLPYGWSYNEIVYKRRNGQTGNEDVSTSDMEANDPSSEYSDGKIGWRKFAIRAQETRIRWQLDDNGGIRGLWQMAPPMFKPVFIPIEKALLFRTSVYKNNPEGRSVLRNAYRPWYYKRRIEEIEAIGIERDLAGLPVIKAPIELFLPDADNTQRAVYNQLQEIVKNIRRDEQEGVLMPLAWDDEGHEMYELSLLTTGGRRQFDTDATVARYDQRIAMTVMADFIMLGHEKVGSFQLGVSKVELFTQALTTWVDEICGIFNTHAIPRLLRLNGVDQELAPKLTHADIERVDLKDLGLFILQTAQAGVLTADPKLEDYVREMAGLPISDVAEDV